MQDIVRRIISTTHSECDSYARYAAASTSLIYHQAFLCIVAVVAVGVHSGIVASTGLSSQFRAENGLANNNFGHDEAYPSGGSFRYEAGRSAGVKAGSYGLRDIDGRVRAISHVADGTGFRAAINTNGPGSAPSVPAAAACNAAPVVKVTTPVLVTPCTPNPLLLPLPLLLPTPLPWLMRLPSPLRPMPPLLSLLPWPVLPPLLLRLTTSPSSYPRRRR
ncbi:cuticle protein 16.8-like [Tropilaelaps mercedesae]|uniref:Cuticle protein 16.8-like n=1 Tax=Tropilaelaps mercedesae TaxID=418985 RepID=A0A1V9XRF5_9ACAR|nr:cuticle protein 16.8-like [Tropilaelaps mercedesae]